MPQDFTKANLNVTAKFILTIILFENVVPNNTSSINEINDKTNYNGIDWDQFKVYQWPYKALKRNPSFIYKYRYWL